MAKYSERDLDYRGLLTTTRDKVHRSGALMDIFTESSATINEFKKAGFKEVVQGGEHIRENLLYEGSTAAGSFDGYEELDNTPQDGMTAAFFPWKEYYSTVSFAGIEKFKNSGTAKITDWIMGREKQAQGTLVELINQHLWDVTNSAATTGNSGKNIISVPNLIMKTPTTGLIGMVNQADNTKWRNKSKSSTATTFAGYNAEIRNLKNTCSLGVGGAPTTGVFDQVSFEVYVNGLDEKTRYSSGETGTVGFEHVTFGKTKLFWDPYVPDANAGTNGAPGTTLTDGSLYLFHTDYMKWNVGKGYDFMPTEFLRNSNQHAWTSLTLLIAQLTADNRKKFGVLYGISPAIA